MTDQSHPPTTASESESESEYTGNPNSISTPIPVSSLFTDNTSSYASTSNPTELTGPTSPNPATDTGGQDHFNMGPELPITGPQASYTYPDEELGSGPNPNLQLAAHDLDDAANCS
ncbi:uncharacterized protein BDV17DRAFT_264457 [Aspergillus undulatus]|uniref:uncharacterized protein n=1 Tax=Aspergillus undulatus TaxID=1810928 RepID=UPI003CCDFB4E